MAGRGSGDHARCRSRTGSVAIRGYGRPAPHPVRPGRGYVVCWPCGRPGQGLSTAGKGWLDVLEQDGVGAWVFRAGAEHTGPSCLEAAPLLDNR